MAFNGLIRRCFICLAILWPSVSVHSQTSPSTTAPSVAVESNDTRKETVYRISDGSCRINWTIYHSHVNQGVIQHRASCDLPLGQQTPLIAKLLEKLSAEEESAGAFRTLYLGRLESFQGLPERLAILAKESPQWDLRRGRPKAGPVHSFVVTLANQGGLFDEWREVFQRFNWRLEVSAVEKVSVSKAGTLPYFQRLKEKGIAAKDRVPYDCQVWLAVATRGK
jgi:hypothetical protein